MRWIVFLLLVVTSSGASYAQASSLSGDWITPNGTGTYRLIDDGDRVVMMEVNDRFAGKRIYGHVFGWLHRTGSGHLLDGELWHTGCRFHLQLETLENATVPSGTSRLVYNKSSRSCLNVLNKRAREEGKKKGELAPTKFMLIRR